MEHSASHQLILKGEEALPVLALPGEASHAANAQGQWGEEGACEEAAHFELVLWTTAIIFIIFSESTIVSEGFKGGTRGSPIMPRDVSLSDSKCWNLVAKTQRWA